MKRRQATVVFNDISGYTSLMQKNEEYAISIRQRHKEVVDRLTQQHKGTIIQYYGDGTLSIFDLSIDAVQCALSMQMEFSQSPQVPLRIGINSGDILLGPDGIYGDSVNIASRIEKMSVPGSILVSEKVKEEIKNHQEIRTKELGQFELKNIRNPMKIHAVINEGIRVPEPLELAGKMGYKEKTIMVLPFYNLSKDPENDFFSDGMTEQIIYALSEIEGLRVTSRTSSFTFKDKEVNLRQLHQDLGIDHVLEGSIRRHGGKVRITAQLVNAADDFHLWSETYTREVTDVFQLEDEISGMISNRLKASFQLNNDKHISSPEEQANAQSDVYEYYHKGRFEMKRMLPGYIDRAIHYFKQASEADPDFYLTWAAMAKAYAYKGYFNLALPEETSKNCIECILEAQRLDANHSRTHTVWALYRLFFSWDWNSVAAHLEQAGKGQDHENFILYNSVLHATGIYQIANHKLDGAIATLRKAQKSDPLHLSIQMELARAYLYNRDYSKALDTINLIINNRPDFIPAYELKGWILFTFGKQREGIEAFEYFKNHSTLPTAGLAGLSYAYARTLQLKEAAKAKELLINLAQDMPSRLVYLDLAIAHLGVQEYPAMFEQLNKALEARMPGLIFFDTDPIWDEIRRFNEYRQIRDQIFNAGVTV